VSLVSPDGAPVPVTYTPPAPVGGQPPVPTFCSSPSGAPFPIGSTIVTCTATDALGRQASCNFNVTIAATPSISKTRFLAFGDSITFGRCGPGGQECPADAYPVRLATLLAERYTNQTFTVANVGIPGEVASNTIAAELGALAGQDRLPAELEKRNPEVLLLMEGTNDLFHQQHNPAFAIQSAELALDRMVSNAQGRGVTVFLATIPPQRAPAPPGTVNRDAVAALVPLLNARIRVVAMNRGVPLVDVYAAMVNDIPSLISVDNLHPTGAGLRVIGETFYAAIRATLDTTPKGSAVSSRRR
jgi:lysophospholipase L1-like esterase